MTHELNCPHSGCPLLGIQNMSRVPELDIIEVLHREIEHLRATVARLRGQVFTRSTRFMVPAQRHFEFGQRAFVPVMMVQQR